MSRAFEGFVARRYLRLRRKERFASIVAIFSLAGIALGVATLIVVMAVMNGFKSDLTGRVLGLHGDLNVYAAQAPVLRDWREYLPAIEKTRAVMRITPIAEGTVLLQAGGYNAGVMLQGTTVPALKEWGALSAGLLDGKWEDLDRPDAVAVGLDLADRAGLSIGSKLTLLSAAGRRTIMGTVPRVMRAEVCAIFDANWNDYNGGVVLSSLSTAQNFLLMGDAVSYLQVQAEDSLNARVVAREISRNLAGRPVKVLDWTRSANGFLDAVSVEENVMFLILSLIILVAAFNVISSMTMIVQEKRRDIAVLRGLGMTRFGVMRVFFVCGATIGVVGTCLGALLGIGFALNIDGIKHVLEATLGVSLFNPEIYFLSHLPAKLVWSDVFGVAGFSLLASFLATLYPAWKAASTDPVEILRNEG